MFSLPNFCNFGFLEQGVFNGKKRVGKNLSDPPLKLLKLLEKFGFKGVPYEFLLFPRFEERMKELEKGGNSYQEQQFASRRKELVEDFKELEKLWNQIYGPISFPKFGKRLEARK